MSWATCCFTVASIIYNQRLHSLKRLTMSISKAAEKHFYAVIFRLNCRCSLYSVIQTEKSVWLNNKVATMYFVFTPHPQCPSYVIRYEILDDPANWVTIDKKTGEVKTVKPIDRESPFLNGTDVYTFLIGAIDNGKRKNTVKSITNHAIWSLVKLISGMSCWFDFPIPALT